MRPERIHRLAVLAEIADSGSISEAARRLGLVKSSISHHVTELEREIGAKLLDRVGRGVTLTSVGEILAAHGRTIVQEANQASKAAKEAETPHGTLRISVPAGIADPLINPMLAAFLQRYPGLSLDIIATDNMVDLISQRIDIAFRIGSVEDDRFIARKLTKDQNIFVASPEYLARNEPISIPADLARHELIGFAAFGKRQSFQLEATDGTRTEIEMNCRVMITNGLAIKSWALLGVGVARMPLTVVAPEIESGTLIRVLPKYTALEFPLFAVYMPERFRPANVRRLIDYAISHFKCMRFPERDDAVPTFPSTRPSPTSSCR